MDELAGSSTVAVAAASTEVMAKRLGRRLAFSITNNSALNVFLSLSDTQEAAANRGILLAPYATVADSSSDVYKCWQGTITAYEATGAASLSCWERVIA